jgi:hypothetical protein
MHQEILMAKATLSSKLTRAGNHWNVIVVLVLGTAPTFAADRSATPSAAERLNAVDAQTQMLVDRIGSWDVVMTLQVSADAKPLVVSGLVAERKMVGRYLAEEIRPLPGTKTPDFTRIAYLNYSGVEGRWQYVSMDTRFPVGIMPANSFDSGTPGEVTLEFAPIAFVGMGAEVEGKMLRSNLVVTRDGKDHDIVRQYWMTSDGTSRKWLGVEYDYRRRSR